MNIIHTYEELDSWIRDHQVKNLMLVGSVRHQPKFLSHMAELKEQGLNIVHFKNYQSNPLYENVLEGVKAFRDHHCDAIAAVGGGSALDVAKCIKLYSTMEGDGKDGSFLKQTIVPNEIPFLAMPTTAGTGSEATRFAVIYYEKNKQSVSDMSCIPETVLLDPAVLETLPLYQKKATMMDALCHAIESFWSVNSTEESRSFSKEAIEQVMANMDGYLANTKEGNAGMLAAANTAGKAINITQTTAGHAMCYKITSLFGCAHGHSAILCNRVLYKWMVEGLHEGLHEELHKELHGGNRMAGCECASPIAALKCIDPRGEEYLKGILDEIGRAMGCEDAAGGARKLVKIFEALQLEVPAATDEQYQELKTSVNPVRLKNHPVLLDEETIDGLYREILRS